MKSIGEILSSSRQKQKISLGKLESTTKIKREFIIAIERMDWKNLPDYAVVAGFVKSLASCLKINPQVASALLKRDYPPVQKISPNPKPDIDRKFVWTPRHTFWAGLGFFLILVFLYLSYEYHRFNSPPPLKIISPVSQEKVYKSTLTVTGKTVYDAVVKINNQPVLVDANGNFTAEIKIFEGTSEIEVKSISRSGKETILKVPIVPELSQ